MSSDMVNGLLWPLTTSPQPAVSLLAAAVRRCEFAFAERAIPFDLFGCPGLLRASQSLQPRWKLKGKRPAEEGRRRRQCTDY